MSVPQQCLVIVIAMLKGGSGKTTSAMMIALHYALAGKRVLVIDGDPISQSAIDWATLAQESGTPLPFEVTEFASAERIAGRLNQLRDSGQYDVIVVDSGGGSHDYLTFAVSAADQLYLTLAPSKAETRRIDGTFTAVELGAARNPNPLDATIVLVRCDNGAKDRQAWQTQLVRDGHPLAETTIGERVYYLRAYGTCPPHPGEYTDLIEEMEAEQRSA